MSLTHRLQALLTKLGDPSFAQTAEREIKDLIVSDVSDGEKLLVFVSLVTDDQAQLNPKNRKYHQQKILLLVTLAEIFQYQLLEFLPSIIPLLTAKFKDPDEEFGETLATAIGGMLSLATKEAPLVEASAAILTAVQEVSKDFERLMKPAQQTAGLSICQIIQGSTAEALTKVAPQIADKIIKLLSETTTHSKVGLFQALHSLIKLSKDKVITQFNELLSAAVAGMEAEDAATKNGALGLLSLLVSVDKSKVELREHQIVGRLTSLKSDKSKNVREQSVELLKQLRTRESQKKLTLVERQSALMQKTDAKGPRSVSPKSETDRSRSAPRKQWKLQSLKFDYSNIHSTIDRSKINKEFVKDDPKKEDTFIAFKALKNDAMESSESAPKKGQNANDKSQTKSEEQPPESQPLAFSFDNQDALEATIKTGVTEEALNANPKATLLKAQNTATAPISGGQQIPPLPANPENVFSSPSTNQQDQMSLLMLNMQYMARRIADLETTVGALQNQNTFLSGRILVLEQKAAISESNRLQQQQLQQFPPLYPLNGPDSTGYRLGFVQNFDQPRGALQRTPQKAAYQNLNKYPGFQG